MRRWLMLARSENRRRRSQQNKLPRLLMSPLRPPLWTRVQMELAQPSNALAQAQVLARQTRLGPLISPNDRNLTAQPP